MLFPSILMYMNATPVHRKRARSSRDAGRERALLRLVQGEGVVPLAAADDPAFVVTSEGSGSLADLLAADGPLAEAESRGVGAHTAHALSRVHEAGIAHADIKPANLIFSPDGHLWLIDFDAAAADGADRRRGTPERLTEPATVKKDDDVVAVALLVIECATGQLIDPTVVWREPDLRDLGCPLELAADVAAILHDRPDAARVAGILQRRDDRLPAPPHCRRSTDPTPTVDMTTTAIAGLSPVGEETAATADSAPARHGWRRWARAAHA